MQESLWMRTMQGHIAYLATKGFNTAEFVNELDHLDRWIDNIDRRGGCLMSIAALEMAAAEFSDLVAHEFSRRELEEILLGKQ